MLSRRIHAGVVGLTALPALLLAVAALSVGLGPNPIETLTHTSGEWALRFLLASLAVTPLRRLFGWRGIAPLRRTFGLAAFCYAALHFSTWLGLDHFFDWPTIVEDIVERPYVTVGMAAFVSLIPLALTSTRGAIRRLGRRWVTLHRLVYASAVFAVLHYLWLVKADLVPPLIHAAILAALLAVRLKPGRARASL